MSKFNEFQIAAIRAYPNDEAKYLLEDDDEVDTQNISVGDSLLTFIIRELDDHMNIEEAIRRMERVRADVEAVLHALTKWGYPHHRGAPPLTLAFSKKPDDSDEKD